MSNTSRMEQHPSQIPERLTLPGIHRVLNRTEESPKCHLRTLLPKSAWSEGSLHNWRPGIPRVLIHKRYSPVTLSTFRGVQLPAQHSLPLGLTYSWIFACGLDLCSEAQVLYLICHRSRKLW